AMIAITTSSSISVKPRRGRRRFKEIDIESLLDTLGQRTASLGSPKWVCRGDHLQSRQNVCDLKTKCLYCQEAGVFCLDLLQGAGNGPAAGPHRRWGDEPRQAGTEVSPEEWLHGEASCGGQGPCPDGTPAR